MVRQFIIKSCVFGVAIGLFNASLFAGVVKGKDDTVQIKLPDGWKEAGLPANSPEELQLIAANERVRAIVSVSVEEETDTVTKLDDYMKLVIDRSTKKYGDLTHTDPKPTRINGKDALRCEFKFSDNGVKAAAVITVIKVDSHFETVQAWAAVENYTRLKSALTKLADEVSDIGEAAGADVVAKGKDGSFQITLPGGWKQEPLPVQSGSSMQLQADNFKQQTGLMVVTIPRADTTQGPKEILQSRLEALTHQFPDLTHTEIKPLKVSGFDAMRCEAKFTIPEGKLAYVLSVVQTPTAYYMIDSNCPDAKFDRLKSSMLKLPDRMKELEVKTTDDDTPLAGKAIAMKSKDNTVQISLPRAWKPADAPPTSDKSLKISAINPSLGTQLLVVQEARGKLTLAEYTAQVVKVFKKSPNITDPTQTEPESIKVNDQDAMRFEFHCTADGIKVAYVVTIIQTKKNFLRGQFWSTESKFAKLKPQAETFIQSLKEVKPDDDDQ